MESLTCEPARLRSSAGRGGEVAQFVEDRTQVELDERVGGVLGLIELQEAQVAVELPAPHGEIDVTDVADAVPLPESLSVVIAEMGG
jgi:hypothetical protein